MWYCVLNYGVMAALVFNGVRGAVWKEGVESKLGQWLTMFVRWKESNLYVCVCIKVIEYFVLLECWFDYGEMVCVGFYRFDGRRLQTLRPPPTFYSSWNILLNTRSSIIKNSKLHQDIRNMCFECSVGGEEGGQLILCDLLRCSGEKHIVVKYVIR